MSMVLRVILSMALLLSACVTKAGFNDPTIMYVCSRNGIILYPPAGESIAMSCGPTYPLTWPAGAPIQVYGDTVAVEALISAVDHWNDQLGFRMFEQTRVLANADVLVVDGIRLPSATGYYVGSTRHIVHARLRSAVILYDENLAYVVLLHELGHVLGLGHDRNRTSIMFPTIDGMAPDADIAENDIEVLRRLYGPAECL